MGLVLTRGWIERKLEGSVEDLAKRIALVVGGLWSANGPVQKEVGRLR
jgi:hypothetical protein